MAKRRKHSSQLLNIHGVNDVRQSEIHKAESLVPEPSAFEVELSIEKLKSHNLPGQIPAELIKAGGRTIRYEIQKLIFSIRKKKELSEEWQQSIIVPIYEKGNSNDRGRLLLLTR